MEYKALQGQGICKRYGKKQVLNGLNVTIEPGHIYGLLGRNGAGKTTLLGILSGQNTLNEGTVRYGDEPVWENPAALAGLCFSRELSGGAQSRANSLRVKDYLRLGSIYYENWDMPYAKEILKRFGVEEKEKIGKLSKGMRSMLTIAVGLASRAPITMLDEPVAGLDVVARNLFYKLLMEDYAQTGRSFVVSTHIFEEAENILERVILLDKGQVIEQTDTQQLVAQFHQVSGRADVVDQALAGLDVVQSSIFGREKQVTVRCSARQLEQAVEGSDLDIAPMNLQNVFLALCGQEEPI